MSFHFTGFSLYVRLAILVTIAAFIGYFVGYFWPTIAIALLLALLWQIRHLNQLRSWLWRTNTITPPQSEGVWGAIYDGLFHLVKKHRSKQRRANQRIRRFRDGAEALPDAALVLSDDFVIEWGNKKAQKLLGIRRSGDVGQRINNLIRHPDFTEFLAKGDFDSLCHIPSPVNDTIQLELRVMPYGTEQVLFLARDVSKIYRLEQMRRDFVANVSHELKTPLTVMRGYVEMIQATDEGFDSHWQKVFGTMEAQVSRMDRLVEQLLTLSKVEINSDQDNKQFLDMPRMLNGLIDDAKWLNQDKNHNIQADIRGDLSIVGIDTEIKSACANLIANAIAYTPAGGDIEVSWQMVGNKAKFSVKDSGPGIKPEHVNRLTERFYRVDKSRSRNTGGSGLGLAIVKHVLQHHNAELAIDSKWGKGSEFSIYFEKPKTSRKNKKKKDKDKDK